MIASYHACCFVFVACLVSGLPASLVARNQPPTVETQNGTLLGFYSSSYNQDFFLNVPYAGPPIGNLRFQSPAPLSEKYENRDASYYGPACFGYNNMAAISQVYTNYSEDCLTLNIVRPSGQDGLSV